MNIPSSLDKQTTIRHLVIFLLFGAITYLFFSPLLEGKVLVGKDDLTAAAAGQIGRVHYELTGERTLWNDGMFSGTPVMASGDVGFHPISKLFVFIRTILGKYPAGNVWLTMLGFFFLLRVLRINLWLSAGGSVVYAFTTFFFLLYPSGHSNQTLAIALIAPLIASVLYAYQQRLILGCILTSVIFYWNLASSHEHMTYYAVLMLVLLALALFIKSVKEKQVLDFVKRSLLIAIAGGIGFLLYFHSFWPKWQYLENSIRSASELVEEKNNQNVPQKRDQISSVWGGLDYDYATAWSHSYTESFSLLIPNAKGGGSSDKYEYSDLSKDPQLGRYVRQLFYWGNMPFTSGTMYSGAVVLFLFVWGLFLIKGYLRYWLAGTALIGLLLSWGNFSILYDLLFQYLPGFAKFRNPSWLIFFAEVACPVLAFLALDKLIKEKITIDKAKKAMLYALYITGGTCLLVILFPSILGNFSAPVDQQLPAQLLNKVIEARKAIAISDAWRSLIFILITVAVLYLFITKKIKKEGFIIAITLLALVDFWQINSRYIGDDLFRTPQKKLEKELTPTVADKIILDQEKSTGIYKTNRDFRVADLTQDLDKDSRSLFFHRSLGGYSAMKMRRYQELIDYYLGKEWQILRTSLGNDYTILEKTPMVNMLNTKYIIYNTGQSPIKNEYRFGIAWFVDSIHWVENATQEINALDDYDLKKIAIVDKRFEADLSYSHQENHSADTVYLDLNSYRLNYLSYTAKTSSERVLVFSELYGDDWEAYIDGTPTPVFRCNYILRGVKVPEGEHQIEFKYIPSAHATGNTVTIITIWVFLGLVLVYVGYLATKKKS